MEISTTLRQALAEKNITAIHSVFYTIAHEDPAFRTGKYEETLEYVKKRNIEGFIVPHDGKEQLPREQWTEDYWAQLASELQDNFSEERIAHLIQVGQKVYGESLNEKKKEKKEPGKDRGVTAETTAERKTTQAGPKTTMYKSARNKRVLGDNEDWWSLAFGALAVVIVAKILRKGIWPWK